MLKKMYSFFCILSNIDKAVNSDVTSILTGQIRNTEKCDNSKFTKSCKLD